METLVISVIVLILSALGFITYKHPFTARKIIVIIAIGTGAIIVGNITYLNWQNDSYVDMEDNLYRYETVYMYDIHDFDMDSLKNVSKDSLDFNRKLDSINVIMQSISHSNSVKGKVYSNILDELRKAADSTKNDIITSLIYSVIGLISLLILYILSYVFQKMWENNSNKHNESLPQAPN